MNQSKLTVDDPLTTSLIIHWALFGSVFVYGGLAFFISGVMEEALVSSSLLGPITIVLSVLSLSVIAFILFVRKYWFSPESLTDVDESAEPESNYVTAVIIQAGLMESIAIYGLMLCILFSRFFIFLPFALTSLALMIIYRPSKEDFERRLERAGWDPDAKAENPSG